MSKEMNGGCAVIAALFSIGLFAAVVFGWASNVYKFTQCDFKAPYRAEIIRGVGIPFPPVGVIAGYMDIDDSPEVGPPVSAPTVSQPAEAE